MNSNGTTAGPDTGDGAMGGPFANPDLEYWAVVAGGVIYAIIMMLDN